MKNLYVGVDIGTTGIRAGVYDRGFRLLGTGSGRSIIHRGDDGSLTQDPGEIYRETAKAVKRALASSRAEAGDVAALSFDGQMAGIMGVDASWKATTPYDSWLDTRCRAQVERMKKKANRKIVEMTGIAPSFNHGPKILWWKENEPGVFERTASFVQPSAYVAGRLCGLGGKDAFIDWTYIHFGGFSDVRGLKWDERLAGAFDVPLGKLPRIVAPHSIIGETEAAEARLFGLPAGVPVAAGCGDTASCFLGTGAVEAGIAVDVAGTASVFALTTDRFVTDPLGVVYTSRSVVDGLWYTMSYVNGGGLNLEWFGRTFAAGLHGGASTSQRRSSAGLFSRLNASIADVEPGSDGLIFVPHLEGRAYPYDPRQRGEWRGFTRSHGIAHFYRSVLEGIGYEYALYRERIAAIRGKELPFEVRAVGGGSKSDVWNGIKADILGSSSSTIDREDISTLGQALIAARAAGHVDDLAAKAGEVVGIEKTFAADRARHERYRGFVEAYRNVLGGTGRPTWRGGPHLRTAGGTR